METSDKITNPVVLKINKILNFFLIVVNTSVAFALFWMVFSRHFLPGSPMLWIEELVILVALWLYFFGAAASSFDNIHINGGFLDIWLNERNRHRMKIWATFCELFILLIYFGLALKYFIYLVNSNKTAVYLRINKSVWELSAVVGMGLMILFVIFHFANLLKRKNL